MPDFSSQHIRFGVGGLDLRRAPDVVAPENAIRLSNVIRTPDGAWTSRLGQVVRAQVGTSTHSIIRATEPAGTPFTTLYWGSNTTLLENPSGPVFTTLDTGYSGNPLALVPWRVAQSGESWMLVGDTAKMRKIRIRDGLVLPIGLPVPSADAATALVAATTKTIQSFSGSAASFTGSAGTALSGIPTLADVGAVAPFPAALSVTTVPGTVTGPFYSTAWRDGIALDLTTYGGGVDITDDDYMHLWVRLSNPEVISEVRIYLVLGAFTGSNVIPGTSTSGVNDDAYVWTFRPSDIDTYVQGTASNTSAVTTDVVRRQIRRAAGPPRFDRDATGNTIVDSRNTGRAIANQNTPGRDVWTEWGSVDLPLRRGDAQRIGTDTSLDWSDIDGIMIAIFSSGPTASTVSVGNFYVTGGFGPDAGDPTTEPYDYVYTNYDPRTGAEGNPSAIQPEVEWLTPLRQSITVTPAAHSDSAMRQRVYRRGGTLNDNWYFVGVNSSNGGVVTDTLSDTEIEAADTAPTDWFQAVPSVTNTGTADLDQAVPYLWGPVNDMVFAAGDPNRPGSVYFCYPGEVDKWGASNYVDVCSPSERIINGFVFSGQCFAWSSNRLYAIIPNLLDELTVTPSPTSCAKAPAAPWAFCVGPSAVYFTAYDGVYQTTGGDAVNLTDDWLRPLFNGETANGLLPIDFTATTALRCEVWQNELWVLYRDTGGTNRVLIYHLTDRVWRPYTFAHEPSALYADTVPGTVQLLMGGRTSSSAYVHSGTADDATAIACTIRTPVLDQGSTVDDKLYSDLTVDVDRQATTLTVTPYLTNQTSAATALTINTGSGRSRYLYNFVPAPTRAQNIALDIAWSSTAQRPVIYAAQLTYAVQPDNRNLRGIDWETLGDTYLTGLNLDLDTFGQTKTVQVWADQQVVTTYTIPAGTTGRRLVHVTVTPPVRGHVYRYVFTDSNTVNVFGHEWLAEREPNEQSNWLQNFEVAGTLADKAVKGVLIECDTFGATKTVQVQIDGVTHTTLSVNTSGRKVVQFSFAPGIGRVVRLFPTDANPGRLYSRQWVFDQEPLRLSRWESQRITHGIPVWQVPTYAYVTLKSTTAVTYTLTSYDQQGNATVKHYLIPSTGGQKEQVFVPFESTKGVLFHHLLTATEAFWLYRPESKVSISPWGSQESVEVRPFGDDDLDAGRSMGIASLQAAAPGGEQ